MYCAWRIPAHLRCTCLCFGCGGVDGVGGEWVGGLDKGRERWGGVMSV